MFPYLSCQSTSDERCLHHLEIAVADQPAPPGRERHRGTPREAHAEQVAVEVGVGLEQQAQAGATDGAGQVAIARAHHLGAGRHHGHEARWAFGEQGGEAVAVVGEQVGIVDQQEHRPGPLEQGPDRRGRRGRGEALEAAVDPGER